MMYLTIYSHHNSKNGHDKKIKGQSLPYYVPDIIRTVTKFFTLVEQNRKTFLYE